MKVANTITTKQTDGKQLKLPYRKLNLQKYNKLTQLMESGLLVVIVKKGDFIKRNSKICVLLFVLL